MSRLLTAGFTALEHATFATVDNVTHLAQSLVQPPHPDAPLLPPTSDADHSSAHARLVPFPEALVSVIRSLSPHVRSAVPPSSGVSGGDLRGPSGALADGPSEDAPEREIGEIEEIGEGQGGAAKTGASRGAGHWGVREAEAFHAACGLAVNLSHHQEAVCQRMDRAGIVGLW